MDLFRKKPVSFSLIVPVYNSEKTVTELARRIRAVFEALCEEYELVMVDDGSRDRVWTVMKQIALEDRRVKIVRLARNFGQQNAVLCGLKFCRGEFVITLDDDLQDPPEEIPKLIEAIRTDPETDVLCGRPGRHSTFRGFFGFLYHSLQNLIFKTDVRLRVTSYKIMRRRVVEEILKNGSKNPLMGDILLGLTNRIKNIDLRREERHAGRSGYTAGKLISQSWTMVVQQSDLPLQLISFLGFASAFGSVAMIAFYLARYFIGGVGVSGWTTLVLINLFFPGMILFSFGVIGQYLIRILKEVNSTPQYVIRETKGAE